jgi:Ca2+/H+ antiporter, TMEM165/GDT1 family
MKSFWLSLFFVFAAEMGDKTQLVALAFAARFPVAVVLSAVFVATLLVHLLSVGIGAVAGVALPALWIGIIAGLAFIGFGFWTLRGDELKEGEAERSSRLGPFVTIGTTFFIAELGDKTMLATVTLASAERAWVAVWLGSTLGMVLADGLAIIAGRFLGKQLPEKAIKYVAAAIFFLSGAFLIWQTLRGARG